jgi:hypothetical protein
MDVATESEVADTKGSTTRVSCRYTVGQVFPHCTHTRQNCYLWLVIPVTTCHLCGIPWELWYPQFLSIKILYIHCKYYLKIKKKKKGKKGGGGSHSTPAATASAAAIPAAVPAATPTTTGGVPGSDIDAVIPVAVTIVVTIAAAAGATVL